VAAIADPDATVDSAVFEEIPVLIAEPGLHPLVTGAHVLAGLIRRVQPDVLHLHGIWGPASRAASLSSRQVGCQVVISPHGMLEPWALERSRWKKQLAWWGWMGRALERSAMLHALCEEEQSSLRHLLPGARTVVIPNGVDLPARQEIEHSQDRIVLFLGRLHPKKGIRELIQGWALSSGVRDAGWQLVIAGWDDGDHEAVLRSLVENLGLAANVTFAGPVYGQGKRDLLRRAGAFALTSFSEGLPMAVLEAWSFGVPILMTDACHLGEGFEVGAAVRVEPQPREIAEGLDRLLGFSDAERTNMGVRGRELVERRFNWLVIGRQMAEMYNGLVERSAEVTVGAGSGHRDLGGPVIEIAP
jgi:poly(glycerol-phosphate) alpha-glucosyltransferase